MYRGGETSENGSMGMGSVVVWCAGHLSPGSGHCEAAASAAASGPAGEGGKWCKKISKSSIKSPGFGPL